jgi:chromate transport protein ChrA
MQKAMNGLRAIAAGIVLGASIALSLNLEWSVLHPAIILITFLFIRFTPLKVTHLIVGAIFLGAVVMQLN